MATGYNIEQGRKHYTEVVAGTGNFEEINGVDYYFDSVDVKAGTDTAVEPIGVPLVWIAADSAYNIYDGSQDISAATSDGAPQGARVALAVGSEVGLGNNTFDVTVTAAGVKMTAYVRGAAGILKSGIDFGAANSTQQDAFMAQLVSQGAKTVAEAGPVATSYV